MFRLRAYRLPIVSAAAVLGCGQALPQLRRPILQCDAAPLLSSRSNSGSNIVGQERGTPLIDAHQFATGSVLGIVAGMLVRRLGKVFMLVLIGAAAVLRMLEGSRILPGLDDVGALVGRLRRLVLNRTRAADALQKGDSVSAWLQRDLSFKGAFTALFLIGVVNT